MEIIFLIVVALYFVWFLFLANSILIAVRKYAREYAGEGKFSCPEYNIVGALALTSITITLVAFFDEKLATNSLLLIFLAGSFYFLVVHFNKWLARKFPKIHEHKWIKKL